jgi:acyl-CoA reductase-like NAD-dependent aldehyde dehydrogenase
MSGTSDHDVESLIEAARNYGTDDPEQEIEALQDLLRAAWNLMTERQQASLLQSDEALTVLEAEGEADEDEDE